MEKFRKLLIDYRYQVFLVIEIVVLVAGSYVAYLTVYRYEIFVRAILGLTIHILFFLEYVVFGRLKNESFGVKFEFPKDLRYFVADFLVIIIPIWAGVQVVDLIRYMIRMFIAGWFLDKEIHYYTHLPARPNQHCPNARAD